MEEGESEERDRFAISPQVVHHCRRSTFDERSRSDSAVPFRPSGAEPCTLPNAANSSVLSDYILVAYTDP